MKINKLKWFGFLVVLILASSLQNCSDSNDNQSKITVRLADAPGDYDQVNVEVLDVLIKSNTDSDESGWISIGNGMPKIVNLLDLTGGVNLLLADSIVPSGRLGQIRLLLGDDNTIVKDGATFPLRTPSGQQSGLKLLVNTTLQPDYTYDFLIDFDVEKSVVVQAGNSGIYNLNPVLRVTTNVNSGAIKGSVLPSTVQSLASIQVNGTTISAYTNNDGFFQLNGVPPGTYTLTITPDPASGLAVKTVENVSVTKGQTTMLDPISL